jgi:hypothetical protein
MNDLIKLLQQALNEGGNRTTPTGTCVIHCDKNGMPMQQTPATFSMQIPGSSQSGEVGDYMWGGGVRSSSWPFHEGRLSFKNGKPVVLTYSKDNVQYHVEIIVRTRSVEPIFFGETVLPFWAVFKAVNYEEADPVFTVFSVYSNLKTEYIKELEEELLKYKDS